MYLKNYTTLPELLIELTEYFVFYNTERMYQSLGYSTPDVIYQTASGGGGGGGATILDKFTARKENHQEKQIQKKIGAAPCSCM